MVAGIASALSCPSAALHLLGCGRGDVREYPPQPVWAGVGGVEAVSGEGDPEDGSEHQSRAEDDERNRNGHPQCRSQDQPPHWNGPAVELALGVVARCGVEAPRSTSPESTSWITIRASYVDKSCSRARRLRSRRRSDHPTAPKTTATTMATPYTLYRTTRGPPRRPSRTNAAAAAASTAISTSCTRLSTCLPYRCIQPLLSTVMVVEVRRAASDSGAAGSGVARLFRVH